MCEPEFSGMKRQPGRTTEIRFGLRAPLAINFVAADRVAQLSEVDADLMGATCFEPAPEQGMAGQALRHFDMGDGLLARVRTQSAAAPAVAAIAHQVGANGSGTDLPGHESQVTADYRVNPELPAQTPLRFHGPREHDQAA